MADAGDGKRDQVAELGVGDIPGLPPYVDVEVGCDAGDAVGRLRGDVTPLAIHSVGVECYHDTVASEGVVELGGAVRFMVI